MSLSATEDARCSISLPKIRAGTRFYIQAQQVLHHQRERHQRYGQIAQRHEPQLEFYPIRRPLSTKSRNKRVGGDWFPTGSVPGDYLYEEKICNDNSQPKGRRAMIQDCHWPIYRCCRIRLNYSKEFDRFDSYACYPPLKLSSAGWRRYRNLVIKFTIVRKCAYARILWRRGP